VILLDFTALFLMFHKKLYEIMGHLCPISDKKTKQRYCRSAVSKLQPAGKIRPAKPFQPAHEGSIRPRRHFVNN